MPLESESSAGTYLVCVSKSDASRVALRFACMKAKKRGGSVEMLHIIEPVEVQTLSAVAKTMQAEREAEAHALLDSLIEEVKEQTGITPTPVLKEGSLGSAIISMVLEDADVNMIVLGAATPGSTGHGKLIAWLSSQLGESLLVPMMLVPGNLTDQQIEALS